MLTQSFITIVFSYAIETFKIAKNTLFTLVLSQSNTTGKEAA